MVQGYGTGGFDDPEQIPLLFGEQVADPKKRHMEADKAGDSGVLAGFVQMLQGNLGPGILTLPFVFTQGGVAATSAMLILVLLLTLYSMSLVLRAKRWVHAQALWTNVEESKRPQSFQAVGRELLGANGERVIIVFVALMQLGICMVFFNFAATELIAVEEYYLENRTTDVLINPLNDTFDNEDELYLTKPALIFAVSPLALALSLGKSPTIIVVSATIATAIMYVTVGTILFLVFWHFWSYFPGWHELQVSPLKPTYLPIAFGNLVYTVTTSIGILLPIENSLGPGAKTKYPKIVTAAMLVTLLLDLSVGMLSNIAFGKQTHESITAEFIAKGIGHPDFVIGINVALAVAVLLTYPLQFRPACEVFESAAGVAADIDDDEVRGMALQDGEVKLTTWQKWGYIPLRFVLVMCTAALAAGVPELDLMVALAGSFTACVLALMIPPAMDFAIMRAEGEYPAVRVILDSTVVLVGILGLVGGTGTTLLKISGVDVDKLLS